MRALTDDETAALVVRAQRGDGGAFAALARAYLRACYAVALAVVTRPADAEDVAQDAFVVALEKIGSCREPARFPAWLLTIARTRALSWLERRRLRDVARDPDSALEPSTPADEGGAIKGRLAAALATLSPVRREVVLLHDLEEWTHAEIAGALGLSEGMSRQHLFQARRELRAVLGEEPNEVGP